MAKGGRRGCDPGARFVRLGGARLDIRRYLPDGRFQEAVWSVLASEHSDDAATGCAEALAALARLDGVDDLDGYDWVLVTW